MENKQMSNEGPYISKSVYEVGTGQPAYQK